MKISIGQPPTETPFFLFGELVLKKEKADACDYQFIGSASMRLALIILIPKYHDIF